jgi:hypothetical protein
MVVVGISVGKGVSVAAGLSVAVDTTAAGSSDIVAVGGTGEGLGSGTSVVVGPACPQAATRRNRTNARAMGR